MIISFDVDDATHFVVDNQTYTVTNSKPFHTIIIDTDSIVFNDTRFHIQSTNPLTIFIDYINEDIWGATDGELVLSYDIKQQYVSNPTHQISGFPPGTEYKIKRDGTVLATKLSDISGVLSFTSGFLGTHHYTISQVGNQPSNHPPYIPTQPYPVDGAEQIDINTVLSWIGGDPDQDPVTYDIYFGTTSPLPLLKQNHTSSQYQLGVLNYNTEYSWRIVSWDNFDEPSEGPTWTFTTEEYVNHPPNRPSNPLPVHQSSGVDINADLFWSCSDPDGDNLVYDICFGKENPPPQIAQDYPTTSYSLNMLDDDAIYYWRIISKDPYGMINESPIWQFTTTQEPNNPPEQPFPIQGETEIRCNTSYYFRTMSTDPDDDQIYYLWIWDDETDVDVYGLYESGQICNVTHQWTAPGEYQVMVKARDTHYSESPWSIPLTITVIGVPSVNANGPYYGYVSDTIVFNGSVQGGIPPYQWTWIIDETIALHDQNTTHIFTQPGDHQIQLTVTDSQGYQSSNQTFCHIADRGDLNVIITCPFTGDVFETISFHGNVQQGIPPYQWLWDFGDGSTSTRQYPTHVYNHTGIFQISLTVTDDHDLTGIDRFSITINNNREDVFPPLMTIQKPKINSFYLYNQKLLDWPGILIIGDLTFEIQGSDDVSGIESITITINDQLIEIEQGQQFEWTWDHGGKLRNIVNITATDHTGKIATKKLIIWKLF